MKIPVMERVSASVIDRIFCPFQMIENISGLRLLGNTGIGILFCFPYFAPAVMINDARRCIAVNEWNNLFECINRWSFHDYFISFT